MQTNTVLSAGDRSKMYEQIGFIDPNTMAEEGTNSQKIIFSQTLQQELLSPPPQMENSSYNNNNVPPFENSTWDSTIHELQQDVSFANNHQEHQQPNDQQFQVVTTHEGQNFAISPFTLEPPYPSPDNFPTNQIQNTQNFQHSMELLGDFATIGQNSNITCASSVLLNDPLFQLNLPQPPPSHPQAINGGGMFQSLPHGFNIGASSRNGFLFGGGDHEIMEGNVNGVLYHEGDVKNQLELDIGLLEFNTFSDSFVDKRREKKGSKHLPIEKQRREQLNGKFRILRSLIPNPTKVDRASVVGDAIEYIRELIRTVNELKLLVEKKRIGKERCKRHKTEDEAAESSNKMPYGDHPDGYIRTSWLQRKSKECEVDVRIIDDEVTIKMVQRKKINFLLFVTKVLDELQLDLHHVAGGHVGEFCSFLFSSKIIEGSSLYASAIANKMIEVMDT